jgi:hypothetical protein
VALNCQGGVGSLNYFSPTTGELADSTSLGDYGFNACNSATPFDHEAFPKSFRYLAVKLGEQSDGSDHVGYVDLKTSEVVDVTEKTSESDDSFGSVAVSDSNPRFLGDLFLYSRSNNDGTANVHALDLVTGDSRPTPDYWRLSLPSLDGKLIAGHDPDINLVLDTDPPTPKAEVLDGQGNITGNAVLPGDTPNDTTDCYPITWLSGQRLLCLEDASTLGTRFNVYDLSDVKTYVIHCTPECDPIYDGSTGFKLGGTTTNLLPANERNNYPPQASPDGAKVMFVSSKGDEVGIFSVDSTGGEPKKVADWDPADVLLGWVARV